MPTKFVHDAIATDCLDPVAVAAETGYVCGVSSTKGLLILVSAVSFLGYAGAGELLVRE